MKVTMIGHSTVLIEAAGKKILTDPYFGTWGNIAYKRTAPPFKNTPGDRGCRSGSGFSQSLGPY